MVDVATLQPPEPLTRHEQSIELVKSTPPSPAWAFYLVAMFTSLGGIIMGWIYLVKDGQRNKLFGIRALLLGFVLPLLIVAIIIVIQLQQRDAVAPLPNQPGTLLP
jgi:hypothetical protein